MRDTDKEIDLLLERGIQPTQVRRAFWKISIDLNSSEVAKKRTEHSENRIYIKRW